MKKLFRLLIISITALVLTLSLASCTKDVGSAEELHKATKNGNVEVTNYSVSKYKGSKNNIEITADFTVRTDEEFFTERIGDLDFKDYIPGRMMQDCTINGNGHTITIKGESNGSLGRYSAGLFARLMNCEVKDLNIVYDIDLSLSSSNSMGGLAAVAENCTITNVTVTYKRSADFRGYRAGGIVGLFSGTMENCTVTGDFKTSTEHFGALVGGLDGGTVKNCIVNGSVVATNLHNSEIGGLFGWMQGEAYQNKVTLSKFSVAGKTDKWTTYNSYCGALVGKIYGNLHDCMLEFTDGATVDATEHSSGSFRTNMHTGVVAGWAAKGSKINNIFIDATAGSSANITFPEKSNSVALGIYKNESTSVENVYYLEDLLVHQHKERLDATESKVSGSHDTVYSFTMCGKECSARICFTESEENAGAYRITSILLKIGGEEYSLTERVDDNPLKPIFKASIDGFTYEATVSVEGLFVDFSKTLNGCFEGGAAFVTDCADINLAGEAGVIGGAESSWKINADGKPQLKAFE